MFNHESPRRGVNFVTKKIVRALCEIKINKKKVLFLGNIDSVRDWGYAKEYCEMLWKILQQKKPDDFVISTNKKCTVRKFAEQVGNELGFNIVWKGQKEKEVGIDKKTNRIIIKIDKAFYRPNDVSYLLGDSKKAKRILKWKPKTSLKELIKIMVNRELYLISKNRFY